MTNGLLRTAFAALLVSGSAIACAAPASAQQRDDCYELSGQPAIDACTREINSGRHRGRNLAIKYTQRGFEYSAIGDQDRALADYDQAIRIDPTFSVAYSNRGVIYRDRNQPDRAMIEYNQAIRLDAKNPDPLNNRGVVHQDKGDIDRAIADYQAAIRVDANHDRAHYNLCNIRSRNNRDLGQALLDCDRSLQIRPRHMFSMFARSLAYYRLNRFDDSIADSNNALQINSRYAPELYIRGLAKLKKGDKAGGDEDIAAARADDA